MKKIPLSNGASHALVDDDDFERLSQWHWILARMKKSNIEYAYRHVADYSGRLKRPRRRLLMHREVFPHNLPHTDHIDGNGLNNQKSNLRPATCSQNIGNRSSKQKNNTSGFKGVCWKKTLQKWAASIQCQGKRIHIGVFNDPVRAARDYNQKARDLFGEFARLNIIPE